MKYTILIFVILSSSVLSSCKQLDKIKDHAIDYYLEYVTPPAETYSTINEPPRVLPKNPAGCPDWKKNSIVKITESIRLPEGCKYDRVKIIITHQSDLVFDCNGAEFNGLDKEFRQKPGTTYIAGREPVDIAIHISSSESFQSRNITVKNCHIKNYVRGIRASFGMSKQTLSDLRQNINVKALENHLRTISLTNVHIENTRINFSHQNGIFVDRFVNGFVLDKSSVNSTGGAAIYLDSGSTNSTIKNSSFTKNGYSRYLSEINTIAKQVKDYAREVIAIDSSFNNHIEGNIFHDNARASIFLYKNCNEFHKDPKQIPRYQSSDGNIITGNTFKDTEIGVWVASRQSMNLRELECGSPLMAKGIKNYGPYRRRTLFYEDFAKNNKVINNTFKNIRLGIIVEDDNNEIIGNTFSGEAKTDITVGTKYRTTKFNHPVKNTKINNNHFDSTASKLIKLNYSPENTVITGNTPDSANQK